MNRPKIIPLLSFALLLAASPRTHAQLDKEFSNQIDSQNAAFNEQRNSCLAFVKNSKYRFSGRPDSKYPLYYTTGRNGGQTPFLIRLETWTAANGYFHCNEMKSRHDFIVILGEEFRHQNCRVLYKTEDTETGHPRLLKYTKCGNSDVNIDSQANTYMSEDNFREQENLINAYCTTGKANQYQYCWNQRNKNVYTRYGMMGL